MMNAMAADLTAADLAIRAASPAFWEALSSLGRQAQVPENFLPQQTAEARGKRWNATIGQITDGRGGALPLSPMAAALGGLDPARRNQAFLYSPVEGLAELRQRWRERQRREHPEAPATGLPIVTAGPVLALSLAATLFLAPGRTVLLPEAHSDGDADAYPDIFTLRTGAQAVFVTPGALAAALADGPSGEPALVVLREPAVAGVIEDLVCAAEARPVIALLDDTSEPEGRSLFWDLLGRHPNLVPVKVDGANGEVGFPGGGVGFLTFPFDPATEIATAIEGKVKMLSRAVVGSPPATGQAILLAGLGTPPTGKEGGGSR
jgi:hypothetical protein